MKWVSDHSFLQQCAVFMLVSVCMCTHVHVHNAWEPLTEMCVTCMHTMFTCIYTPIFMQGAWISWNYPNVGSQLETFSHSAAHLKGELHTCRVDLNCNESVSVCVHVCALCLSYNCCMFACRRTVCLHAIITCMHAECMMSPSKF